MQGFKTKIGKIFLYNYLIFFGSITVFSLAFNASVAFGQQPSKDTIIINQMLDSGYVLEGIDSEKALLMYKRVISESRAAGFVKGEAKGYHYSGIVYSDRSDYATAFKSYQKALELYKSINNARGVGSCYTNLGNLYRFLGKPDSAVFYYQAAVEIFKEHSQQDALSQVYGNIGGVFHQNDQQEKALSYFSKALELAQQLGDSSLLCRTLVNEGTAYYGLREYEKSKEAHSKAAKIAEVIGDTYALQLANINLADYYKIKEDYQRAIDYGLISLKHALKLNIPFDIADIKKRLGDLYINAGDYEKGKDFYDEAIKIAEEIRAMELVSAAYNSLHQVHAKTGEYEEAYNYLMLAREYEDSVFGEKQLKIINELEVKYQTSQKDKALAENQLQLEKNKQYIIYSIGAGLIGLLLAFSIYFYYKYKRKIYLKQLHEIRQEKEIQILQALMQGEEKERTRIAQALHDEVAGMLAAAKMHLDSVGSIASETTFNAVYKKITGLLDEASLSVRKTAHNLMPEVLMNYGLDAALRRYCYNISSEEVLVVQYDSWGDTERYSANFELSVYRIVQELLNNIVKHSKASEALVQVNFQEDILSITVEDNGVGFESQDLKKQEGMGISSLQSRVNAMNGKIDINTSPGQGVSTYLEFEISKLVRS